MDALVTQSHGPLWYDRRNQPIHFHDGLSYFQIKEDTGGRPVDRYDCEGHPLTVGKYADLEELVELLGLRVGNFYLFPKTSDHQSLPQIAYVRIEPEHVGLSSLEQSAQSGGVSAEFVIKELFKLLHRHNETHEANTLVLQKAIESQSNSLENVFSNVGMLLSSASTTISIANGIEKIEREPVPEVDVDDLAEKLDGTIKSVAKNKAPPKWMPLVSMAMQGAQGFAQAFLDKQKATVTAADSAPTAAPAPASKPVVLPVEPDIEETTGGIDLAEPSLHDDALEPANGRLDDVQVEVSAKSLQAPQPVLTRVEQLRLELALDAANTPESSGRHGTRRADVASVNVADVADGGAATPADAATPIDTDAEVVGVTEPVSSTEATTVVVDSGPAHEKSTYRTIIAQREYPSERPDRKESDAPDRTDE